MNNSASTSSAITKMYNDDNNDNHHHSDNNNTTTTTKNNNGNNHYVGIVVTETHQHNIHQDVNVNAKKDEKGVKVLPVTDSHHVGNASIMEVVTTWSEGTSVHGIPYALNHSDFQRWKRVLWWCILACFSAIMTYLVVLLVQDYLEYQTETSVSFAAPDWLPFPQVTICNRNLFQASRLATSMMTQGEFPSNEEQVRNVSQPLTDFFVKGINTTFNRNRLSSETVWNPVVTPFGLCWQFDPSSQISQRIYNPGSAGGLGLTVNIQQEEYLANTDTAGAIAFLQEPGAQVVDQIPFVWLQPGQINAVSLKMTEYHRERDQPWSHCRSRLETPHYTPAQCRAVCKYDYIATRCQCRLLGDNRPHVSNLPYCQPSSSSCENAANTNATLYLKDCQCRPPPCEEIVFNSQVHRLEFADNYLATLSIGGGDDDNTTISRDQIRKNIIQIRINYDTIQKQVVVETKAQTTAGLLAAIGGQMGLWAGISFISVLEVVGELGLLRLMPRLVWGDRRLYGVGSKHD